MKEDLYLPTENKMSELYGPLSRSGAFCDISSRLVECKQHDGIAADVQSIALSLFKEYVNSIKDFSSLIKVKQNVKTKESSTSPMHSPTHSIVKDKWLLQSEGTGDNFQQVSGSFLSATKQRFEEDKQALHDTQRNLMKENRTLSRNRNSGVKINSLWKSEMDSPNMRSLSGQCITKCPRGIIYAGQSSYTEKINQGNYMLELENKCKLSTEKQSHLNCEQTNQYGGSKTCERRDPLLMTQSEYIMNSAGRLNPVLLNSNLDKVKSEVAFNRPYTKMLWPADGPVPAACSNREVRMKSWLQLRTVPTYHAIPIGAHEESNNSHTNGATAASISASSYAGEHREAIHNHPSTELRQQVASEPNMVTRLRTAKMTVPLFLETDEFPDSLRRTEKLSSPSSSEMSMQSVISIKINDESGEKKAKEFGPDYVDNVRRGHHSTPAPISELPPYSRSFIFNPLTPADSTLSNQGLTPAELNTLISHTGNVIKRNRPTLCRTPQRPLSMNVECATTRPSVLRLPRQQLRAVRTDASTQTDEIPSLNYSQDRVAEPDFEPGAHALIAMSNVENGTLVDSTETLSPIETWPLSIQSVVKPAEFTGTILPATSNNSNSSANHNKSEAFLSVTSPKEVKDDADTCCANPNDGRNVASAGLSRRSSLAGPCHTSTNTLQSPPSRTSALMRQTRFPSGIHKYDSTAAEGHRCRSVHFSTDVLVAHTGHGPTPLMLSSAPLKEPHIPPFARAPQSVDTGKTASQRARRSSSVSMLISTNPKSNTFGSHRAYVPTTQPCLISPISPIRKQ